MISKLFKPLSALFCIALVCIPALIVIAFTGSYLYIAPSLPDTTALNSAKKLSPLEIYSVDGMLIGKYGNKVRLTASYRDIPKPLVNALLAAEDDSFFRHSGADIKSLARAIYSYIDDEQDRSGGSTVTMQLAKLLYLSSEQTIYRKLQQIFLALHIEKNHSKEAILERYMNTLYLGHGAYGFASAAETYYGLSLAQLNLAQSAMLAGLAKAPSVINPINRPQAALARRNWILGRMYKLKFIDYLSFINAKEEGISATNNNRQLSNIHPNFAYAAEYARQFAYARYGDDIYSQGYTIYTTIHSRLQHLAQQAVIKGLERYTSRHGYRGPEASERDPDKWSELFNKHPEVNGLYPAIVTRVEDKQIDLLKEDGQTLSLKWHQGLSDLRPYINEDKVGPTPSSAKQLFTTGDLVRIKKHNDVWQLTQVPKAQGALVAMYPKDGSILAISGGYDYRLSQFNRASQAKRQPGSTLKPLLYAAAMEKNNLTPASIFIDEPLEFETQMGFWRPENASGKYYGPTTMRRALYFSRNVISIRIMEALGIKNFIDYLTRFGIDRNTLPYDLSLALGSNSLSPIELAQLFSSIANGCFLVTPFLVEEIQKNQQSIYFNPTTSSCLQCQNPFSPTQEARTKRNFIDIFSNSGILSEIAKPSIKQAQRVMDSRVNFLINDMLKDVIKRGTAQDAKMLGRDDIAGKTGTTNGPLDAWFAGFHPSIVTTTWLGFDFNEKLGKKEYGGSAALPTWISFMHSALKGIPIVHSDVPEGIIRVNINPKTGKVLQHATASSEQEFFRAENIKYPTPSYSHSPSTQNNTDTAQEEPLIPLYDTQQLWENENEQRLETHLSQTTNDAVQTRADFSQTQEYQTWQFHNTPDRTSTACRKTRQQAHQHTQRHIKRVGSAVNTAHILITMRRELSRKALIILSQPHPV